MSTHAAEKSALDEFLPEAAFTVVSTKVDLYLSPSEVHLDPIEAVSQSRTPASSPAVEMWPMLAAALVAIGVSILALAAAAKFGFAAS